MIKKYLPILFLLTLVFSCNNETKKDPTTDIGVARAFVRNILDNKFDDAERYLLKDETNGPLFQRFKTQYSQNDKATLEKYKNADIIVNETNNIKDSVYFFKYINSYKKTDTSTLKLLRTDGKWLVDFKFTFSGN